MFSLLVYLGTFASIFVVLVVSKVVQHLRRLRKVQKALAKFPSEQEHWFWGHLHKMPHSFGQELIDYLRKRCKKNPRAEAFLVGSWYTGHLRVWHPDTVKTILKSTEPKYEIYGMYQYGKDWLGDCLLLSSGDKWARNRKLLTPSFHFSSLKHFVKIKNTCSQILLDKLLSLNETSTHKSVEMFTNFALTSSDILLRCAFSHQSNIQQEGTFVPYIKAVKVLDKLWVERTLSPWLYNDWVYKLTSNGRKWMKNIEIVHGFTRKLIAERKREGSKVNNNDFLDILLAAKDEDGNSLSDVEVQNEVDVFMFAGHETTTSALSWTAFCLATHPADQAKCQQEVDELLRGRKSDEITHEDLNHLPYLTMCIKEAMRMHCIVPILEREVSRPLSIDGVELPVHTIVTIIILCLHFNEQVWQEPHSFKPDRFSPQNVEQMDPFQYVPFSAGPRNCIGQHFAMNELKIVLARLLRRVTFKADENRLPRPLLTVVMMSENGVHLFVQERKNQDEQDSVPSS